MFDASSILHGWDNYPPEQFPALWAWLGNTVEQGEYSISPIAFAEVSAKAPECGDWLNIHSIQKIRPDENTLQMALSIKAALGIVEDQYHGNGVGENDILIVATASCIGAGLVSDEAIQTSLPVSKSKYKIPAVCDLDSVRVECTNFVSLIKDSGEVFG